MTLTSQWNSRDSKVAKKQNPNLQTLPHSYIVHLVGPTLIQVIL